VTPEEQVQLEREELAAAVLTKLELGPPQMRCHWCGQLASTVTPVYGPQHPHSGSPVGEVRWKGWCCNGAGQ
jgi:hypothetical protein